MKSTTYQIWRAKDGSSSSCFPVCWPTGTAPRSMELIHEFFCDDDCGSTEDVRRAFAYYQKYMFDTGEWPEGCRPKGKD